MMPRHWVVGALRGGRNWGTILCLLISTVAMAKATVVTLPELVKESDVIVYGHMLPSAGLGTSPSTVTFETLRVLKGSAGVRPGATLICNPHVMLDRPDLSKLMGDHVLFLVGTKHCLGLSHSYRSIVPVDANRARTAEIDGQPEEQLLQEFIDKVQKLVGS